MKYILSGLACCIATTVYSQCAELKYKFPDSVDSAILRGFRKSGTDSVYVQFYGRKGRLNVISVRRYHKYKGELLEAVLSSFRVVEILGKKLPIMFDEDMMFESHFRKYSISGNGYVIKFTDRGKVREEYETQ